MGFGELLVILFLVLLFFGATRLPALGEGLGKAIRNLKGAADRAVPDDPATPKDAPKELPNGPEGKR